MHPDPKRIAPIILLIGLAAFAIWYLTSTKASPGDGPIEASGTIEATQINLASEIGGKVVEVIAQEGQAVSAGQVLIEMDDSLILAQLDQARASLNQAQANYDLIASGPTDEQRQVAVAAARLELLAAEQALQDLDEAAALMAAKALQDIALAEQAIDRATQRQDNLAAPAEQADIDSAKASVVMAKDLLDKAREDYEPYANKPEDNLVRAVLLSKMSAAQNNYDAAVTRLNNMLGIADDIDIHLADSDLAVAQAQLADANRRYELVKNGPDPNDSALAKARLQTAEANLAASLAEPSQEQLALAQAQVEAAQAAVAVLETQLDRLTILAPSDGIILERLIEPGEVALPSTPLLSMGRLDDLTITVYVPEDRYGDITLGQTAQVSVDSFPGQDFDGRVIHIADEAEYTPRNVQTQEGRRTTVFAVKLVVANAAGKLKPGMPADVNFGQ
jgi:multidrug efflux pump subunit AcrA (membrane-fusion protein)